MATKVKKYRVGEKVWVQDNSINMGRWLGRIMLVMTMPGKYLVGARVDNFDASDDYKEIVHESRLGSFIVKKSKKKVTKKKATKKKAAKRGRR